MKPLGLNYFKFIISLTIAIILIAGCCFIVTDNAKDKERIRRSVASDDCNVISNALALYFIDHVENNLKDSEVNQQIMTLLTSNSDPQGRSYLSIMKRWENGVLDPWGMPYKFKIINNAGSYPVVDRIIEVSSSKGINSKVHIKL